MFISVKRCAESMNRLYRIHESAIRYFMSILVFNHPDGEERAGCFA